MCAGAISHARIGRVVFGVADEKGGGVVHGARVFDQPTCHWKPQVEGGFLADERACCAASSAPGVARRAGPAQPPKNTL
jgi:tRNA(Arg) A34 adenosine deaminase TadA